MNDKVDATADRRPEWEKPEVMALGELERGFGGSQHICTHGTSVSHVCGNGSTPNVDQCKSGNNPPSGSCASGNNGD